MKMNGEGSKLVHESTYVHTHTYTRTVVPFGLRGKTRGWVARR